MKSPSLSKVSHASIFLLLFYFVKTFLSIAVKTSLASFFGAGKESDAYFAAFTIPQQLGDFLIGGVIFAIIIPIYQQRKVDVGEKTAAKDVSSLLNITTLILIAVTIIYYITIPSIVPALFDFDLETSKLTIELSKLLSPTILLMGLALLYTAFYHAHRHFIIPATAALLFPLSSLAALWFLPESWGIYRLGYGNLMGSILGLFMLISAIHNKVPWQWNWSLRNPVIISTLLLSWPMLLQGIFSRFIPLIQKSAATAINQTGSLSIFDYSLFICGGAFSLIAGTITTAVFPLLGEQKAKESKRMVFSTFSQALSCTIFLTLPIAVLLLTSSNSIVKMVLGYGKFSEQDIHISSILLTIIAIAIVPQGIAHLTHKVFCVFQDTRTVSFVGIFLLTASVPLYYKFSQLYGLYGIAAVYTTMAILTAVACIGLLKIKFSDFRILPVLKSFALMLPGTIIMALILIYGKEIMQKTGWSFWVNFPILALIGGSSYLISAKYAKLNEFSMILQRIPFFGKFAYKLLCSRWENSNT